ncbi:MAG: hypothetical protein AAFV88_02760 [Planctomycetota bacterium]
MKMKSWLMSTLVCGAACFATSCPAAIALASDDDKKDKESAKKEIEIRIDAALSDELPASIRKKILRIVGDVGGKDTIELKVDGADGDKKQIKVLRIGKGSFVDDKGNVTDFMLEGDALKDGEDAIAGLPKEIQIKVKAAMEKASKQLADQMPGMIAISDMKTNGRIVVVGADGEQKVFRFGDGEDGDLNAALAKLPKELSEKLKSVQLTADSELTEAMKKIEGIKILRTTFDEDEAPKADTGDRLEKKLDSILRRLDQLESKMDKLQNKS